MCCRPRLSIGATRRRAPITSIRRSTMSRRGWTSRHLYAGWARHHLVVVDGRLRIKLKRVDLVNPDAAFGNIQLFM